MVRIFIACLCALAIFLAFYNLSIGNDQDTKTKFQKYDNGPAVIDVSKYPIQMQENYKLFAKKCSTCHTLARAINCDFVLHYEWESYLIRMMRRPNSGLDGADGKKILDFLDYDSKTRKKDLYQKRLKSEQ